MSFIVLYQLFTAHEQYGDGSLGSEMPENASEKRILENSTRYFFVYKPSCSTVTVDILRLTFMPTHWQRIAEIYLFEVLAICVFQLNWCVS